jgi:hypothetical protein
VDFNMKSPGISFVTLMATLCVSTMSAAQRAAERSTPRAEIVEVVGCVSEAPGGTWVLTRASEPVTSKTPATTTAALKEAAERPLGSGRFRLLGVSIFKPEALTGHKVAAKGVLIKDPQESRLNVTSLQAVATTCAK